MNMRIAFGGESLIDFTAPGALAFQGREGRALTNSAIAAARMGQPTGFVTQLSTDLFGERLLGYMRANGIDTRFVPRSAAPTTLAFVERTPASDRYAFYMQGTADTPCARDMLPPLPDSCRYLHFGSTTPFGAGLSVGMLEQGVEQPSQLAAVSDAQWRAVLRFAVTAAALNCTREGADPPRRAELSGRRPCIPLNPTTRQH